MSKDEFDVSEIISDILNPRKEWEEITENREQKKLENKTEDSSMFSTPKRVKEIHISDKKNKKFVFPGNFVVSFEGNKLICSCE